MVELTSKDVNFLFYQKMLDIDEILESAKELDHGKE